MVNKFSKLILFAILLVFAVSFISAWDFYGYVYDVNGTALYNATINITFWTMNGAPTFVGSNSSTSNATHGWFNFSVYENSSYSYKPVIRHFEENKTDGSTPIDYVGQSLPWFPFGDFNGTTDINFYLREAGTINITVLNRTGHRDVFYYQIKDTKLGYPVEEQWDNQVSEAIVYLPRDRNYSIMVYPNETVPVSFNWNNFSATSDYSYADGLSKYNVTNHTLHKQFNCTDNGVRVYGYIKNSTGQNLVWNEFTVVPYLLEPGNMVYLGQTFPYNMSFGPGGSSDNYNLATGFYNISLPGAAEVSNIILFATARNGTDYYGGFRNLTLNYSSSDTEINFTMYSLMAITGWASADSNITMDDFGSGTEKNISSAKQAFNLVNASNPTQILPVNAHIEITVDYSDYNCTEFTFMMDIDDDDNGTFYLPLINATGVKEMNIYSNDYAPKRVATMTVAEILANNNITMAEFNPRDIDGTLDADQIFIEFYLSNSDCDVPNPGDGCQIGAFGPAEEDQERDDFSPLSVIIGGGKLSFRMGYGGIKIHYVNVDMLASGPPDVAFESDYAGAESKPSGGTFSSALKFGDMGPTIYDYVLVSIPYTQGSTSVAGLDESEEVNISLPLFYTGDDVDTLLWNTATNGTNGTLLAGNYSHYSAYSSEWEILMGDNTCNVTTTGTDAINTNYPCHIDTTSNRIWIRIPHFDGNEPSISGSSTTVSTDDTTSPGGSSGVPEVEKTQTHSWMKITPGETAVMKDFDKEIGIKQIQIEVKNEAQNVKVIVTKYDTKPAEVSVEKTGKVQKYLQIETENLEQKLDKAILTIQVDKSWVSNNTLAKEDISLFKFDETAEQWNELTTIYTEDDDTYYYYDIELTSFSYFAIGQSVAAEEAAAEEEERNLLWLWILIAVIVLVVIIGGVAVKKRKH